MKAQLQGGWGDELEENPVGDNRRTRHGDVDLVTARVSYKFGGPMIAKY